MALDKKFHKTGGSHIHFHSMGIICDRKYPVRSAALPGDFFKANKHEHFVDIFYRIFCFNLLKIHFNTEMGEF